MAVSKAAFTPVRIVPRCHALAHASTHATNMPLVACPFLDGGACLFPFTPRRLDLNLTSLVHTWNAIVVSGYLLLTKQLVPQLILFCDIKVIKGKCMSVGSVNILHVGGYV